jgi:hypothetical protein
MNWPLVAAIASFVAGLIAAFYWYRASQVNFVPFEEAGGVVRRLSPLNDPEHWIVAIDKTLQKSGKRNRIAAIWTAVSLLLTALAAVLSALPQSASGEAKPAGEPPAQVSFL